MTEHASLRLHAVVHGRVQAVGFRAFVIDVANRLGIKGWVRNRWDGTVEVVAEGERPGLEQLLASLKVGPRMASVEKVDAEWLEATGEFFGFYSRQTV